MIISTKKVTLKSYVFCLSYDTNGSTPNRLPAPEAQNIRYHAGSDMLTAALVKQMETKLDRWIPAYAGMTIGRKWLDL